MGVMQNSRNFHISWLTGRSTTAPHHSHSRKLLPNRILLAVALVASVLWLPAQALAAQTLDQAIANQLDLDCNVLTGGAGGSVPGLEPDLAFICD